MGTTEDITFLEILLIGMLGMFVLGTSVVIFFVVYQKRLLRQQRSNEQLKTEHQKKLLAASLESQERERQRVAEELHDEVGSLLSAAKLHISQALSVQSKSNEDRLNDASDIIAESLQSIRRISHDLKPPVLMTLGLIPAIRSLVQKISQAGALEIDFETDEEIHFSTDASLHFYRIVQELLQNGLKHADATAISLELHHVNQSVVLDYSDNGKGLSTSNQHGLGMKGIQSRVDLLNGSLDLHSSTEPGTHITIETPITHVNTNQNSTSR